MRHFAASIILVFTAAISAQRPEVVVQSGHGKTVMAVAYSPDGRMLASGDAGGTVKLWDLATNKEFRSLGVGQRVEALAFSIDGKLLYVADGFGAVHRFDPATGVHEVVIAGNEKQLSPEFAFNAQKAQVAQILDDRNIIRVSSLIDGKPLFEYQLPKEEQDKMLAAPDLDGDSQYIYFGGDFFEMAYGRKGGVLIASTGQKIAIVDPATGKTLRVVNADFPKDSTATDIDCLAVSDDDKMFASCGTRLIKKGDEKSIIAIRSVATGELLRRIDIPLGKPNALAFGRVLAGIVETGLDTYAVRRWDPATGTEIGPAQVESPSTLWDIESLAFSPDGKTLAVGAGDSLRGSINIRDTVSGLENVVLGLDPPYIPRLRYFRSGLFFAGNRLLDLRTGKVVRAGLYNSSFSSDGSLYSRNIFDGLSVRRTSTDQAIHKFPQDSSSYGAKIDISADDRYYLLHSGSSGTKTPSVLFDAKTNARIMDFPDSFSQVVFGSDGRFLAYVAAVDADKGRNAIKIWNLETKKQSSTIEMRQPINDMAFDPLGKLLAVAGRATTSHFAGNVGLFDIKTGVSVKLLNYGVPSHAVVFSPDGKWLASAADKTIKLAKREDWTTEQSLSAHESTIKALAFSPDGKRLTSAGWDSQVIFWDLAKGVPAARLLLVGDTDHLLISPDNFYLATRKGAASAIAFRSGTRAFPFEQFDVIYNRPDLALAALGTATPQTIASYNEAYKRRLRQLRLSETDIHAGLKMPEAAIDTSSIPSATREKSLQLKITASDAANRLSSLNVYVNDVPLFGSAGVAIQAAVGQPFVKTVNVELTPGRNRIQASVLNEKGIESIRQTVNVRYDGPSPDPELYVVGIGVSEYRDAANNLSYPAKDVESIIDILEKRAAEKELVYYLGGVPKGALGKDGNPKKSFYRLHKLVLTNADAVLEKIEDVRQFLAKAKPEDQVVVFIAGHGLLDKEKRYYFATHDIDFKHPETRGLSFDALDGLLGETAARRKVLLLDTCHAGELDPEVSNATAGAKTNGNVKAIDVRPRAEIVGAADLSTMAADNVVSDLFADLRLDSGTVVISASGGMEYAYESPKWSGGVFTHALRLGLEHMLADTDRNGQITIADLRDYVGKTVVDLTDGRQRPHSRRESIEFDFRVY